MRKQKWAKGTVPRTVCGSRAAGSRKQRLTLRIFYWKKNASRRKEIYYKASMKDSGIGMATVYRMINMLERIWGNQPEESLPHIL